MTYDLMFNPPADIAAGRARRDERDLAAWGLLGAVDAIVSGAKNSCITDDFRLRQLADAFNRAQERIAAAEAKYEAAMAAWSASLAAEALTDPANDLTGI